MVNSIILLIYIYWFSEGKITYIFWNMQEIMQQFNTYYDFYFTISLDR